MSDIEKEFFEAMKIKPTMLCQCSFKNLKDYRYEYGDDSCEHLDDFEFSCKDCEKSIQNIPLYPPITSDIVLKLSKILMDFGWLHCEKFAIDKYLTEFDNDELKDKIQVVECNFEDCILKTCIKLKDEISDQVKALFKC